MLLFAHHGVHNYRPHSHGSVSINRPSWCVLAATGATPADLIPSQGSSETVHKQMPHGNSCQIFNLNLVQQLYFNQQGA